MQRGEKILGIAQFITQPRFLLKRRSYVRIVLGRPNFISIHIKVGWRIGPILVE